MKMTKKDYYSKSKKDCPCCGWQGCSKNNLRKYLGFKNHRERLNEMASKDDAKV